MDFDLEQALDFVEKRNTKRSIQYNEKKKKKRKLHSEQAPDNELSDVISAFPLHIALQPQITTNAENNCLLKEQMDENLMEYEENFDDTNQLKNLKIDDTETIDSSSDSSECCNDCEIIPGNLLHHYTSISAKEFCSNLLTLLRKSNTCKLQANRLLSFISSILPSPNNNGNFHKLLQIPIHLEICDIKLKKLNILLIHTIYSRKNTFTLYFSFIVTIKNTFI